MTDPQAESTWREPLADLKRRLGSDEPLRAAVGAEFVTRGQLEYSLLRSLGLNDGHRVVDIGCGSGRLAYQLAPFPMIDYVGSDVASRPLAFAHEFCRRPDLRFVHTDGVTIPCQDASADFICFFSVFKHLTHEDIFHYFLEANAKLKAGGVLVMSFQEFQVPQHWESFIAAVDSPSDQKLNQFVDRDAIEAWAAHSGFEVPRIYPGDVPHIPIPRDGEGENGTPDSGLGSLGQSVAVLRKRRDLGAGHAADPGRREGANAASNFRSPANATSLRMTNTSARFFIGAGEKVFVKGIVLRGTGAKSYLVRAIGPALEKFNVTGVLSAPTLTVYDEKGAVIASGRGWDAALEDTFVTVGAFALPTGSADAALVVTLTEGNYSIAISGEGSGVALAEIYELPVTRAQLGNAG